MKKVDHETISTINEFDCAGEILNTIPLIMASLRTELRRRRPLYSMPQFRILRFLSENDKPTLSDLADHIGLMHPTVSKMVDGLVQNGLLARAADASDRRRIRLELTAAGKKEYRSLFGTMRRSLATTLGETPSKDRQTIFLAMNALQSAFQRNGDAEEIQKAPIPPPKH